jgi:hypothetical protein
VDEWIIGSVEDDDDEFEDDLRSGITPQSLCKSIGSETRSQRDRVYLVRAANHEVRMDRERLKFQV